MKNATKIIAVISTITMLMLSTSCSNKKLPEPIDNTNVTTAAETTVATTTETTVATTTAVTTPPEDLTTVPKAKELIMKVSEKMAGAKNLSMQCDLKGRMLVDNKTTRMIKTSYKLDASDKASHLTSTMEDLNDPSIKSSYEEYQALNDGILSTYTLNKDVWQDNTPKIMLREDMVQDKINSVGLINILRHPGAGDDVLILEQAKIARTEDGGYTAQIEWGRMQTTDVICTSILAGLIRCPDVKDTLTGSNAITMAEGITYTFDKDYALKNISCDIIDDMHPGIAESFDLHIDVTFSDWDATKPIIVPNVTPVTAETTAAVNANTAKR